MWENVLKNATSEPQCKCDSIQFNKYVVSMGYMQSSQASAKGEYKLHYLEVHDLVRKADT